MVSCLPRLGASSLSAQAAASQRTAGGACGGGPCHMLAQAASRVMHDHSAGQAQRGEGGPLGRQCSGGRSQACAAAAVRASATAAPGTWSRRLPAHWRAQGAGRWHRPPGQQHPGAAAPWPGRAPPGSAQRSGCPAPGPCLRRHQAFRRPRPHEWRGTGSGSAASARAVCFGLCMSRLQGPSQDRWCGCSRPQGRLGPAAPLDGGIVAALSQPPGLPAAKALGSQHCAGWLEVAIKVALDLSRPGKRRAQLCSVQLRSRSARQHMHTRPLEGAVWKGTGGLGWIESGLLVSRAHLRGGGIRRSFAGLRGGGPG